MYIFAPKLDIVMEKLLSSKKTGYAAPLVSVHRLEFASVLCSSPKGSFEPLDPFGGIGGWDIED